MTSKDHPSATEEQNKQEINDDVSKLIEKWKNMSFDEDSDDDFDPKRDKDKPEYASIELWRRRYYRWECKKKMENFDPLLDEKPISFEEKTAILAPEFNHSVLVTSPDHWDIGSLMICEKIEPGYDVPPDIVCLWIDNGFTYCLRKCLVPKLELGDGNPEPGRIYDSNFRGVWTLSPNVFCKTQRWVEGVTTDAESIRFVNKKIPSIPTEELIYDWIDHSWHRWFMLSRRVSGTRLYEAWPQLKSYHKFDVAEGVAKYAKLLASFTSEYIETVTGKGVEGKLRLGIRDALPEWKPRIEPRVSKEEFKVAMDRAWGKRNIVFPDPGVLFVLQHRDLNPTNIFVTIPEDPEEEAKVTAIIDWQSLAYHQKWEVATTPRALWSYAVHNQEDGNAWQWMLSNALYDEGFRLELDFVRQIVPKELFCNVYLPWERDNNEQEGMQEERKDNNYTESSEESVLEEVSMR